MRWISVKERLPEIGQEVIVNVRASNYNKGRVTALVRLIAYEGDPGYHWDNMYGGGNTHVQDAVTHWMPLPEPPKESK